MNTDSVTNRHSPRGRTFLLSSIFIYFASLITYLVAREHINTIPVWWVTISTTKLLLLSGISFIFAIIFISLCRSRSLNALTIGFLFLIPFLSYADMYAYRGSLDFSSRTSLDRIVSRNNAFLGIEEKIRRVKEDSSSSSELWRSLQQDYIANERYGASNDIEDAIKAMLLVSAFFDYGNADPEHKRLRGCISNSEESNFREVQVTYERFRAARIGCCTDYAYALSSFLTFLGYQNEYVLMPGHIANRVLIEGSWYFLDSTTNIFVKGMFDKKRIDLEIEYFPNHNISTVHERYVVYGLQAYLIKMFHERTRYFWRSIHTQAAKGMESYAG